MGVLVYEENGSHHNGGILLPLGLGDKNESQLIVAFSQ